MRIAQLHWGFPPIIGGVETHLALMLPEMVKVSHDVSLLTGSVESEKERYTYQGVEIFRTPLLDLNWLAKRGLEALGDDIKKCYSNFIESAKPEIIHVHNMHYFSEIHIKILEEIAVKKGIPLILTAHNVWDDILFLKLTREIKWTYMIAVSHYIKRELMGVGIEDDRITVIHHGIDINLFNPKLKPDAILKKHPKLKNKQIVFHPARMGMAKGCDTSIKAMNIVKEKFPEAILVLAGTKNIIDWTDTQQKDIAYFVGLVKTFNLKDNVYIDVYPLKDMPELYALSQVCIYPSRDT
jgi:glycosyltransferase involved in cell wall biosynthesis